jgi:hypothetical protein
MEPITLFFFGCVFLLMARVRKVYKEIPALWLRPLRSKF